MAKAKPAKPHWITAAVFRNGNVEFGRVWHEAPDEWLAATATRVLGFDCPFRTMRDAKAALEKECDYASKD